MEVRALPIVSALLLTLTIMLKVAPAEASEAQPAALNWVRDAEARDCLDAQTLARRVEDKIGHPIFVAPSQASLIIEGTVTHGVAGYVATLELFDVSGRALGEREVKSNKSDCAELADTVVLVLAVMVDPESVLRATPGGPTTIELPEQKPPASPPETQKTAQNEPVPCAPSRAKRIEPDAHVFGRVAWGVLPNAGFAVGVSGTYGIGDRMAVRAEAAGYGESSAELSTPGGGGARLRLLLVGAQFCPLAAQKPAFGFYGCLGAEAGVMQNRAFDLMQDERDSSDPVVNATARVGADFRIVSPVTLMLGTNLVVPTIRTKYEATALDGSTRSLFEARPFGISADLGLGARF